MLSSELVYYSVCGEEWCVYVKVRTATAHENAERVMRSSDEEYNSKIEIVRWSDEWTFMFVRSDAVYIQLPQDLLIRHYQYR